MQTTDKTEKTVNETFSIAIHQGKTFIGFYTEGLPVTDRSKAFKFQSFESVKNGAKWIQDNWFRIYGYNVTPMMLTNFGV